MCSRPSQRWATVCESSSKDHSSVALSLSRALQAIYQLKMLENGYRLPTVRFALSLPSGNVQFRLRQNTKFVGYLRACNDWTSRCRCTVSSSSAVLPPSSAPSYHRSTKSWRRKRLWWRSSMESSKLISLWNQGRSRFSYQYLIYELPCDKRRHCSKTTPCFSFKWLFLRNL